MTSAVIATLQRRVLLNTSPDTAALVGVDLSQLQRFISDRHALDDAQLRTLAVHFGISNAGGYRYGGGKR